MSIFDHVWGKSQRVCDPAFPHSFEKIDYPSQEEVGRLVAPHKSTVVFHGMSRRDYFAARAPAAPDWFSFEAGSNPPKYPSVEELSPALQDQAKLVIGCKMKPRDAEPEVQEFMRRYRPAKAEYDAWRRAQQEAKFFAWRFYYADQMIKASQEES